MDVNVTGKMRRMTVGLILSSALNVGLVTALFVSGEKETFSGSKTTRKNLSQKTTETNEHCLEAMSHLSFSELVASLTNLELVEEGYLKRDLALAALAHKHYFHLEKAISSFPLQKRKIVLSSGETVDLFPGLGDEQYAAIIRFAYQEKWPLTTHGLFHLLKKQGKGAQELSLKQAFFMAPEFFALQTFFQKTGASQDPEHLLDLVLEAGWDFLERFFLEQTQVLDFSSEKRRSVLLSLVALHSQTAAKILLKTDFAFVKQRLEDRGILAFLALLPDDLPELKQLCLDLAVSPRSDTVRSIAKARLGHEAPLRPSPTAPQASPIVYIEHVVKEKESLWKIAKLYHMKVEEIVALNELEKDRIVPGMILKVKNQGRQDGKDGNG